LLVQLEQNVKWLERKVK
jgi:hypothetical protein